MPPPASPPVTHLVYLHGFRSSPASAKAQQTLAWLQAHAPHVHCWCPQLPPSPAQAMALVRDHVVRWPVPQMGVIGSSLGGFYATCLVQEFGCRALLINPAVQPARDLAAHIGEQQAFHSDYSFHFRAEFVDELRRLTPDVLRHPDRITAVVTMGDEVLDWREMAARYAACDLRVLEGRDHAFSDYAQHLPGLMGLFGWP